MFADAALTKANVGRIVFGTYAGTEKIRIFTKALAIVVGLDSATKLIAFVVLREGRQVTVLDDALWFKLWFHANASRPQFGPNTPERDLGMLVLMGPVCLAAFAVASAERSVWKKVLLLLGMGLIVGIFGASLGRQLYPALGEAVITPARMVVTSLICLLLLRLSRSRTNFTMLAVLTSANLGNISNLIVVPRGVVDFVHIAVINGRRGVGNLADLVITGATILIMLFVPLRLVVAVLGSARPRWLAWVDEPLSPEVMPTTEGGTAPIA